MKKLLIILSVLLISLTLVACSEAETVTDFVPPALIGYQNITYTIGEDTPDYLDGIEAIDSVDGDVTSSITIDDSRVDLETPGIYDLYYYATDASGNQSFVKVLVIVLDEQDIDTISPVILGASDITYYLGDPTPHLSHGVTAYDNKDGNITQHIKIDQSNVDYETPGTYDVTYEIEDSSGNVTRIIIQVQVLSAVIDYLNIYYINDTHGAILKDGQYMGLSAIGHLILDEKAKKPDQTIFIAGGDILQGSLLSNYFYGESTIDILNAMQLDSFTIGNHEFDWSLEKITRYFDPTYEGIKANFPLLGANVFYKDTTMRPDFIDAYQIIEKANIKIGIIGTMGYGLESSIATAMVEDYEFADPVYWTGYYAKELRENHDVDVVLAVNHGASDFTNQGIGALTGTSRVDATFNGHSHQNYVRFEARQGVDMPVIQSSSNGRAVGRVRLDLNPTGEVIDYQAQNLTVSSESRLSFYSPLIDTRISVYYDQVEPLLNEVIIKSKETYTRDQLTYYMAELIRVSGQADIGLHNFGGTRSSLEQNQDITVATLYDIFPFDNKVKTVLLKGSIIIDFIEDGAGSSAVVYKAGLSLESIDPNLYYVVATNEYVFDQTDNPFIYGDDILDTGIIIRDVLEDVLRNQAETSTHFDIDIPVVLSLMHVTVLLKMNDLYEIISNQV